MKSIVGVYESHNAALKAVQMLKNAGINQNNISLLSKADLVNDHIHVKSHHTAEKAEVSVGVIAGAVVGVLTGIGIFAIPGLGFLYGAGALVGAIAGVDFGLITGGVVALLTRLGIDEANAGRYEKHLNEGKFLIFDQGDDEERKKGHEVLHTSNLHLELEA